MPIFCTEYLVLNEVGRPCKMGGEIVASDWEDAKTKAEVLGHTVLGVLIEEIPAPEMREYCRRVQKRLDEEWTRQRN